MPQGPIGVLNYAIQHTWAKLKTIAAGSGSITDGTATTLKADPNGNLIMSGVGGQASQLAISNTAGAVVKASPGMLIRAIVTVAGSAAGLIYDAAATAGLTTASTVATIPATIGIYELDFPCLTGIVVATGAGQQVSVSYQ